jgi:tetratricopeptide (TPR) repeat protein
MNEKNWKDAEPILKQMVAAEPNRWEFYQALANAQVSMGDYYQSMASGKARPPETDQRKPEEYAELSQKEYEDAIASYQKGVEVAQSVVSGTLPKDPRNPSTDPVKAKAGMGQMLGGQGNAYLKVKKSKEAVESFTKAAEMDPNPAVAYFNLCATQYNTGNTDGALAACDKAIAADPNKADAYYIKGSLMVGQGTMDKDNKVKVPAGTEEALKKYLALAPDGAHAADVKQMLEFIGSKVETTYKTRKK